MFGLVLKVAAAAVRERTTAATEGLVELNWISVNDPSAGSPTETLLRLLLPLSDKVYTTYYCNFRKPAIASV